MPNFLSKDGVWEPAKEKVALTNDTGKPIVVEGKEVAPGEPYIYEGLDRAAKEMLDEQGVKKLGVEFWNDPEMINRAKQMGYKDVFEYATALGWEKEKSTKDFEEKSKVVHKHEPPKKSKGVVPRGGGADLSGGGNDIEGAWDLPKGLK